MDSAKEELKRPIRNNPQNPATRIVQASLKHPDPVPSTGDKRSRPSKRKSVSVLAREKRENQMAAKINQLHSKVIHKLTDAFMDIIKIGEVLADYKREIPHGGWYKFVDTKLNISRRQVSNYIRIYKHRDDLRATAQRLEKEGIKPTINRLLNAIIIKDSQNPPASGEGNTGKTTKRLSKEERLAQAKETEIQTILALYRKNSIGEQATQGMRLHWNHENPENPISAAELEKALYEEWPDIFAPKIIHISLDLESDLWKWHCETGGTVDEITNLVNDYIQAKQQKVAPSEI